MHITLTVSGKDVCRIEIWEDRVPALARALNAALPITTVIQHGKIVGDLLFCGVPLVAEAENAFLLQDVFRERRARSGTAEGAVCFYNPRQQICLFYGDDLADEPFQISYIGEVIEGAQALKAAGVGCWESPGGIVEFRRS